MSCIFHFRNTWYLPKVQFLFGLLHWFHRMPWDPRLTLGIYIAVEHIEIYGLLADFIFVIETIILMFFWLEYTSFCKNIFWKNFLNKRVWNSRRIINLIQWRLWWIASLFLLKWRVWNRALIHVRCYHWLKSIKLNELFDWLRNKKIFRYVLKFYFDLWLFIWLTSLLNNLWVVW